MIENKKNPDKFKVGDLYETEEYIGSGSTGVVYKAIRTDTKEKIAIKVLKTELTKNYKFINILTEELKDIFTLEHQNIVKFFDILNENDKYFIIMEYFESKSLEEFIKERKKISIDDSIKILEQCSLALDYSSTKGISHKSLKPQNIIINNNIDIKITDFGFSKAVSTAWLTLTGTSPTQVEYMSPEQAEGENADHRTDIYSLGIIMYQLLTGDVPFKREGTSILSVAMKHINNKPDYLIDKNPEIPIWLENIVLKCLEKSPNSRFQSGKEIYDLIQEKNKKEEDLLESQDIITNNKKQEITNEELNKTINGTLIINDFKEEIKNNTDKVNIKDTEITIPKKTQELEEGEFSIKPPIKEELVDELENIISSEKLTNDENYINQNENIIKADITANTIIKDIDKESEKKGNNLIKILTITSLALFIVIIALIIYIIIHS